MQLEWTICGFWHSHNKYYTATPNNFGIKCRLLEIRVYMGELHVLSAHLRFADYQCGLR